jgi:hypothetical protein
MKRRSTPNAETLAAELEQLREERRAVARAASGRDLVIDQILAANRHFG